MPVSPLLCGAALVQDTTFNKYLSTSTMWQVLGTQESAESHACMVFYPLGAYNLVGETDRKQVITVINI